MFPVYCLLHKHVPVWSYAFKLEEATLITGMRNHSGGGRGRGGRGGNLLNRDSGLTSGYSVLDPRFAFLLFPVNCVFHILPM
jgi:hypothetical protein